MNCLINRRSASVSIALFLSISALYATETVVFDEAFSSITTGNNTSTSGSSKKWEGNENFPAVNTAYQAGGAVKLGTASSSGSITTKSLDLSGGTIAVTISAKGWTAVEGTLIVSMSGGFNTNIAYTATMSSSFEEIRFTCPAGGTSETMTIGSSAKRVFIDSVGISVVTVPEDNNAPVLSIDPDVTSVNVSAGETVSFSLSAEDADGDNVIISAACTRDSSVSSSVNQDTGVFTWIPMNAGSFDIVFAADDGKTRTFRTVTVNAALCAPVPDGATNISATGFTAKWQSVTGAVSYLVDIASGNDFSDGSPVLLFSETFDGLTSNSVPSGWSSSEDSDLAYSQNAYSGKASPAYKFSKAGQGLESPEFLSGGALLKFFSYGYNNSGSILTVSALAGEDWVEQGEFSINQGRSGYELPITNSATRLRFSFKSRVMNFSLDDVVVTGPVGENTVAISGAQAESAVYAASGLRSATEYYIRVRAVGAGGSVTGEYSSVWSTVTQTGNVPPEFTRIEPAATNVFAGETVFATLYGMDANDDELTYSIVSGFGELDGNNYTWAPERAGEYTVSFKVSDASGLYDITNMMIFAALSAPNGITFTNKTETSFTVQWNPVCGADGYSVDLIQINDRRIVAVEEDFAGFASASKDAWNSMDDYTAVPGWSGTNVTRGVGGNLEDALGGLEGGIKLGGGSTAGWIETPPLDLSLRGGWFSIQFDARSWEGDKTNEAIIVSLGDKAVFTNNLSYAMERIVITGMCERASGPVRISASRVTENRFYMDNLVIASGIQTETTIAAGLKVSGTHADFTELAMNRLYKAVITAEDENGITSGQSVETGKPADPSPATVIIVK